MTACRTCCGCFDTCRLAQPASCNRLRFTSVSEGPFAVACHAGRWWPEPGTAAAASAAASKGAACQQLAAAIHCSESASDKEWWNHLEGCCEGIGRARVEDAAKCVRGVRVTAAEHDLQQRSHTWPLLGTLSDMSHARCSQVRVSRTAADAHRSITAHLHSYCKMICINIHQQNHLLGTDAAEYGWLGGVLLPPMQCRQESM